MGLTSENEERSLERVFGEVVVVQDPTTDAEDQPAVPPDEELERRLVPVLREPGEEVRIGDAVRVRRRQPADQPVEQTPRRPGHGGPFLPNLCPETDPPFTIFRCPGRIII